MPGQGHQGSAATRLARGPVFLHAAKRDIREEQG